jgi:hypothetical protein
MNKPPAIKPLDSEQQRTVIARLDASGGVAPLSLVAAALGMPEPQAETALRFSGFLVNNGQVT